MDAAFARGRRTLGGGPRARGHPVSADAPGLALETATDHVSVAVIGRDGVVQSQLAHSVGHGHTQQLSGMVSHVLAEAGVRAQELRWIASDLGPGSFTGVRVGLATAHALALVSGARLLGASSLTSLAHAAGGRGHAKSLIVPLVGAGRRDLYAGFYRVDSRGRVRLVAAPRVDTPAALLEAVAEVHAFLPDHHVRFVGPGAARERATLESAWAGSTLLELRHDGLSAVDLAASATLADGPGAGLPAPGHEMEPAYVRPAQAEEKVRHKVMGLTAPQVRRMAIADLPAIDELEHRLFGDPWPRGFFLEALADPGAVCLVAERQGALAGYLIGSLYAPDGELQNLGTAPEQQRCGIGQALLAELFAIAHARDVIRLLLEVRVSNFAAQALYRKHGFHLSGLRRGYYKAPDEDALLMAKKL